MNLAGGDTDSIKRSPAEGDRPLPSASVIIPTLNRRDMLKRVIDSVLDQSVPVEVLVMDDGSTDGTAEMVRDEYPDVTIQPAEESRGPTFRRNAAAAVATTPYLFTLDDDCELVDANTIADTLQAFDHPRIGGVTLPFINVRQDDEIRTAAPDAEDCYIAGSYWGGMIAFRRDAFQAIGGYREALYMHGEESDLSIRMLNAGYVIRLGRVVPLHHHESATRNRPLIHRLGPQNQVLFVWHNVPMPYFLAQLAGTMLNALLHGCRRGRPVRTTFSLTSGLVKIPASWAQREPVRGSVFRLYRYLRSRAGVPFHEIEKRLPPQGGTWPPRKVSSPACETRPSPGG